MSAPIGSYVPLIIVAMVTWKVANSPSTSSTSATSAYRQRNPCISAWGSSISERVSAKNIRHSRIRSSPRSLAASTNGYAGRGSRSVSPGDGRMRMGGAGSRLASRVPRGTRGLAEGGRR
ncbi:unnamed protein product [Tuber melanosporum]|uniref:(Perigord truffle) hypothetical protein n=1 Tax=Tuber melanosporum (strain Mel28) TaxID=656061 RepID=D5GM07_TUBMM|nr:uncharacterized protein GSTUM_00010347001 [Tuber melanosporum]CAZ85469.1 unnamed protein product [Tuber melanosporum]